jgi:hypothetical protein
MNFLKLLWRTYSAHVLMVAFLVGLFGAVLIGVQQSLASAESSLDASLSAVVFLQSTISDAEAGSLQETLRAQDPEIRSAEYLSRAQAYEEAMKNPALAKSLSLLKSNPLPPSITIRFSERALWERADPTEKIRSVNGLQEIRWDAQALSLYRNLHRWRMWGIRLSGFIAMMLLVWAFIGLYRVLAQQAAWLDVMSQLVVGAIGGALAWGVWGISLKSIQLDLPFIQPIYMQLLPLFIGIVAALGCYGLEVKRAD